VHVWTVAHANGGDTKPVNGGGVPPVGRTKQCYFFVCLELVNELWNASCEKGMIHGCGGREKAWDLGESLGERGSPLFPELFWPCP
jgi:hypothetical protein